MPPNGGQINSISGEDHGLAGRLDLVDDGFRNDLQFY